MRVCKIYNPSLVTPPFEHLQERLQKLEPAVKRALERVAVAERENAQLSGELDRLSQTSTQLAAPTATSSTASLVGNLTANAPDSSKSWKFWMSTVSNTRIKILVVWFRFYWRYLFDNNLSSLIWPSSGSRILLQVGNLFENFEKFIKKLHKNLKIFLNF